MGHLLSSPISIFSTKVYLKSVSLVGNGRCKAIPTASSMLTSIGRGRMSDPREPDLVVREPESAGCAWGAIVNHGRLE